jgi:hypothetical protein
MLVRVTVVVVMVMQDNVYNDNHDDENNPLYHVSFIEGWLLSSI